MTAPMFAEMPLGEILNESRVLDGMTNRSKKGAIESLVDLLYKQKLLSNKAEAVERVLEREGLLSTALGSGVAIPHARLEVGPRPVMAFGRHPDGLAFDTPDGKAVHLIALVLWKPEQTGLFNRLFGGLVSKLADAQFRRVLMVARDGREMAKALSGVRVDLAAGRAPKYEVDMLIALQLYEAKRRAGAKGLGRRIELARAELPGSILSRFDRLLERYGEALVDAPRGVCTGCHVQLSSSFASEMLRHSNQIYICERCGRFLVHRIG